MTRENHPSGCTCVQVSSTINTSISRKQAPLDVSWKYRARSKTEIALHMSTSTRVQCKRAEVIESRSGQPMGRREYQVNRVLILYSYNDCINEWMSECGEFNLLSQSSNGARLGWVPCVGTTQPWNASKSCVQSDQLPLLPKLPTAETL